MEVTKSGERAGKIPPEITAAGNPFMDIISCRYAVLVSFRLAEGMISNN